MRRTTARSSTLRRLVTRLAALTLFGVSGSAESAGGSPGDPRWELVTANGVAAITVKAVVSEGETTNANPPRLKITVGEVVRGKFDKKELEVIWMPPPHGIDFGGEDEPLLIKWKKVSYPPPKVGTKWIATYYAPQEWLYDGKTPALGYRYPYADEKLAWTKQYIKEETARREKAQREWREEIERVRKADAEVEKKADLKQLYKDATDVVLAKRVSGGLPYMSFRIERRIKDSSKKPDEKHQFMEVFAAEKDMAMVTARLDSKYATNLDRMLLFLGTIPATRDHPPSYLGNVDPRLFEFVDHANGVLVATEQRLKELKAIAED